MEKFSKPFHISYENQEEIDFNQEGIGFLVSAKIKDIPLFLERVVEEDCFSYEYSGFCFGPITEGEKTLLEKGLVEVYVMDTKTIISNAVMFDISLQLAHRAIEAVEVFHLKEKGLVDDTWIEKVKHSIPQLETKLKNIP